MGDAGPPTPPPGLAHEQTQFSDGETPHAPVREVRVLVTGFGVGFFSFPLFHLCLRPVVQFVVMTCPCRVSAQPNLLEEGGGVVAVVGMSTPF